MHPRTLTSLTKGITGIPVFPRIHITSTSPCKSSLGFSPSPYNKNPKWLQEAKTSQNNLGTPKSSGTPDAHHLPCHLPQTPANSRTLLVPQHPKCISRCFSILGHAHPMNTGTQRPCAHHPPLPRGPRNPGSPRPHQHPSQTLGNLVSCSPPVPCEKRLDVWAPQQKQQDPDGRFRSHFYSTQVWG